MKVKSKLCSKCGNPKEENRPNSLRCRACDQPNPLVRVARKIAMLEYQTWNHVPKGVLRNATNAVLKILEENHCAIVSR